MRLRVDAVGYRPWPLRLHRPRLWSLVVHHQHHAVDDSYRRVADGRGRAWGLCHWWQDKIGRKKKCLKTTDWRDSKCQWCSPPNSWTPPLCIDEYGALVS
jgi:hypothetical protein